MDRRMIGALAAVGVLVLAVGVWAFIRKGDQPDTSEPSSLSMTTTTATTSAVTTTAATTATPMYILGAWEDKLAVFTPPAVSPDQVYDVYLSSLPEEEQQRLRDGIKIYDEQTLASLLEDYTS